MSEYHNTYHHISFTKRWTIDPDIALLLGESLGLINAISETPIMPEYRERLMKVSLIRGAQASTAIEGNTLSFDDIENILAGGDVPPSKEYQKQEVTNVIGALNTVLQDLIFDNQVEYISPELLQRFHFMIGKDVGAAFNAVPGQFRKNNVIVGAYRPPSYKDVPGMVERLCEWLREEFRFDDSQKLEQALVQAVVTHIYIAWIHPFSDGNGRTARLAEFFLLMRAGVPNIASHILSNHYNETRTMYYRMIEEATAKKDISPFLRYALEGFRDGLKEVLHLVQQSQLLVSWRNHIFETFNGLKNKNDELGSTNRRRRECILSWPIDMYINPADLAGLPRNIAVLYRKRTDKTIQRDLEQLEELDLLVRVADKGLRPYVERLKTHMALRRGG